MAPLASDWCDAQPYSFHHLCSLCAQIVRVSHILSSCTAETLLQVGADLQEAFEFRTGLELLVSAHKGCHLCSLFWSCIEEYKWDRRPSAPAANHISVYHNVRFHVLIERSDLGITLTLACAEADSAAIEFFRSERGQSNLWSCLTRMLWVIEANDQDPLCSPPSPWHLSSSTCSDAVMNIARQWLEQCLLTHMTCSAEAYDDDTPFIPSRLLDVRTEGLVSLHIHSLDGSQTIKYLALSHVWGNAKIFKLTRATFAELRRGIDISRLPATFQDAIHMTRFLGYGFIWIDSVCIIQDSKEDWAKEAATMASVYANATCTIAATQESSHNGCFVNRNPLALRPYLLSADRKLYISPSSLFHASNPSSAPISRRAWTLQERVRSRRILYLGTKELWWECSNLVAAESYPEGVERLSIGLCRPEVFFENSEEVLEFRDLTRGRTEVTDESVATWHKMVQEHSQRDLTYDSDKLIAMQGILQPFQQSTGLTFLAGLIKERIILELSWYMVATTTLINAPFPSWSWASVKGLIRYRALRLIEGFQGNAQLLNADPDPPLAALPAVSSQRLTLLGFCKRVSWTLKKALRTQSEEVIVHDFGDMWFENLVIDSNHETWLLLLGRAVLNDDDYERFQVDFGLVLTKSTGSTYRRVGLFTGHEDQNLEVFHLFDEQDKQVVEII